MRRRLPRVIVVVIIVLVIVGRVLHQQGFAPRQPGYHPSEIQPLQNEPARSPAPASSVPPASENP